MKEFVLNVNGMMCEACEKRVQNMLSQIDGVQNVIANHNTKTVTVTINKEIDENILKEKIEDIGYEVIHN